MRPFWIEQALFNEPGNLSFDQLSSASQTLLDCLLIQFHQLSNPGD